MGCATSKAPVETQAADAGEAAKGVDSKQLEPTGVPDEALKACNAELTQDPPAAETLEASTEVPAAEAPATASAEPPATTAAATVAAAVDDAVQAAEAGEATTKAVESDLSVRCGFANVPIDQLMRKYSADPARILMGEVLTLLGDQNLLCGRLDRPTDEAVYAAVRLACGIEARDDARSPELLCAPTSRLERPHSNALAFRSSTGRVVTCARALPCSQISRPSLTLDFTPRALAPLPHEQHTSCALSSRSLAGHAGVYSATSTWRACHVAVRMHEISSCCLAARIRRHIQAGEQGRGI
eukprot:3006620-Prymnesium_polylepis.1